MSRPENRFTGRFTMPELLHLSVALSEWYFKWEDTGELPDLIDGGEFLRQLIEELDEARAAAAAVYMEHHVDEDGP